MFYERLSVFQLIFSLAGCLSPYLKTRRVFVSLFWLTEGFCQLIVGLARFVSAYFGSRTVSVTLFCISQSCSWETILKLMNSDIQKREHALSLWVGDWFGPNDTSYLFEIKTSFNRAL